MVRSTSPRYLAGIAVLAPAALLAALLFHPHLSGRLPDYAAIASAVEAEPTRWALAHLAAGVASGLIILAFLAVRAWLREGGEEPWSAFGVPFVVLGSILYAMLPGMEFAPLAAVLTGQDAEAMQAAINSWFLPTLLSGGALFAVGAVAFAVAIVRSRAMPPWMAALVAAGFVVMAIARLVPIAEVQFHVHGIAGLAAFWPLAWAMRAAPAPRGSREGAGAGPAMAG